MRVLNCPVCSEAMIVVEYLDVELDTCASCGGVWLDGGELEALAGSAPPPKALPAPGLGPPDRDCPVCVAKLVKDRYAATQVVVDRCPDGDGIWLDAGELEAILAASGAAAEPSGHDQQAAAALKCVFGHKGPKPPNPKE